MAKRAIIVIDMLNDFVTGSIACERAQRIIPPLQKLLAAARESGVPVIYSNDGQGNFTATEWLPPLALNVGAACAADIDGDGDLDLLAGNWPEEWSHLYRNDTSSVRFRLQNSTGFVDLSSASGAFDFWTNGNIAMRLMASGFMGVGNFNVAPTVADEYLCHAASCGIHYCSF